MTCYEDNHGKLSFKFFRVNSSVNEEEEPMKKIGANGQSPTNVK